MGHTWRVGGTRACKSRPRLVGSEPLCEHDPQARLRAHRVCSVFYGREFSRCRQIVEVDVYVRWVGSVNLSEHQSVDVLTEINKVISKLGDRRKLLPAGPKQTRFAKANISKWIAVFLCFFL